MCVCLAPAAGELLLPLLGWLAGAIGAALLFLAALVPPVAAVLVRVVAFALTAVFALLLATGKGIWHLTEYLIEVRAARREHQAEQRHELAARAPLALEAPRPQLSAGVRLFATPRDEIEVTR